MMRVARPSENGVIGPGNASDRFAALHSGNAGSPVTLSNSPVYSGGTICTALPSGPDVSRG